MDNPLSGSKTFEYLIMPKIAGEFVISPVDFTYFDPATRQYRTLQSPSFPIEVVKGKGDTLLAIMPGISKEDVTLLNRDIRFIKTKPFRVHPMNSFLSHTICYYLLFVFVLLIFILLLVMHNRMMGRKADVAGLRLRSADKYARKRLRKSEILLKQGNDAAFFEELLGALWGYLSDKLNIPAAILSHDTALAALQSRLIEQEITDQFFRVTEICEMARYARVSDEVSKEKLYRDALDIISILQQKLKSV
jgi:hypothetical protein